MALHAVLHTGRRAMTAMLNKTIERLRVMKMNAFASELERQLKDISSYSQLVFEDRSALLVDSEWNRRQDNKLTNCIRNAHFSNTSATMKFAVCMIDFAMRYQTPLKGVNY